jgi:hypothetical protein
MNRKVAVGASVGAAVSTSAETEFPLLIAYTFNEIVI